MDGIAHIKWDSKVPLDLLQARKAFELAGRYEAPTHAKEVYDDAQSALNSANQIAATSPKSRELLDVARRAVMLSNEALNISMHRIESIEVERKLAQRRAETEALERRAAEAEAAAETAEKLAAEVRTKAELARLERERLATETTALRDEKSRLEISMQQLSHEKSQLQGESARLLSDKNAIQLEAQRLAAEKAAVERDAARLRDDKAAVAADARRLQREKDELNQRLQSALSHVADTQESARGFVINLPDILFDLNEAELKPETQVILAKLTGILLIIGDQNAVIEGHTDSTGAADYNRQLSQKRATAVLQFLQTQGLDSRRLKAVGYGMDQPVADNSTPDGRKRNRRVEIVITDHDDSIAAN
jgi:outer membrane protein OmpA-like peptidoglycan-associated protein